MIDGREVGRTHIVTHREVKCFLAAKAERRSQFQVAARTDDPAMRHVRLAEPARQVTIGGLTAAAAWLTALVPPLAERLITRFGPAAPASDSGVIRAGNLHQPGRDLRERAWRRHVREQSVVVAAQMRPQATAGLIAGLVAVGLAAFLIGGRLRGRSSQARGQSRGKTGA